MPAGAEGNPSGRSRDERSSTAKRGRCSSSTRRALEHREKVRWKSRDVARRGRTKGAKRPERHPRNDVETIPSTAKRCCEIAGGRAKGAKRPERHPRNPPHMN